jgi:hypothetical protein
MSKNHTHSITSTSTNLLVAQSQPLAATIQLQGALQNSKEPPPPFCPMGVAIQVNKACFPLSRILLNYYNRYQLMGMGRVQGHLYNNLRPSRNDSALKWNIVQRLATAQALAPGCYTRPEECFVSMTTPT